MCYETTCSESGCNIKAFARCDRSRCDYKAWIWYNWWCRKHSHLQTIFMKQGNLYFEEKRHRGGIVWDQGCETRYQ